MNDAEAEEGNNVGAGQNDDNSSDVAYSIVAHSSEELACDNAIDSAESDVDGNVQESAELGSPNAKGVSRGCDLSEAQGWAQGSRECWDNRASGCRYDSKADGFADRQTKDGSQHSQTDVSGRHEQREPKDHHLSTVLVHASENHPQGEKETYVDHMRWTSLALWNSFSAHALDFELVIHPKLSLTQLA